MENTIKIETVSIISINQISKPTYSINEEENVYYAIVKSFTPENQYVQDFRIDFTKEEYDEWGAGDGGDDYMKNLILSKLSFTEV